MKEGRENNLMAVEEDSYAVFFSFLLYLYTAVACTESFTLDDMVELLYLANRYFIVQLKLICEKRIQQQFLNSRTAIPLFEVCLCLLCCVCLRFRLLRKPMHRCCRENASRQLQSFMKS
jgi:hypothetical protein